MAVEEVSLDTDDIVIWELRLLRRAPLWKWIESLCWEELDALRDIGV